MKNQYQKRIFTIPNLLTAIRLLLIPLFLWLYCARENARWSAVVLVVSGSLDVLDGYIARRCHMESNLGRVLDPIADKLGQAAMCFAMIIRYPIMFWLLIFFAVKEFAMAVLGWFYMRRTGVVNSARWYGKASTIVQFAVMLSLILNPEIRDYSAYVLISLCMATHVISLISYVIFYIRSLLNPEHVPGAAMRPLDWNIMVMYLLLMVSVFLLMFTSGDSFLSDVLPKPLYLFLRFASIVGTVGIPAFFLGEKLPRSVFDPDRFPYRSFAWEKEGRIYDKLGIQKWKTRIPDMSKYITRPFSKQGNMMRDPNHLRRLVKETCSAEFVHWALIVASPVFPILMEEFGLLSMLVYIVGNLLFVIIQRYNRPRIQKIIQRIEKRKCADC
jgi:cardiolipin synthase